MSITLTAFSPIVVDLRAQPEDLYYKIRPSGGGVKGCKDCAGNLYNA